WSIGFFTPDLQQTVLTQTFEAEAKAAGLTGEKAANYLNGQRIYWAGITLLMMNVGAFGGMFAFSWLTSFTGRKPAFAITLLAAAGSTIMVFALMSTRND